MLLLTKPSYIQLMNEQSKNDKTGKRKSKRRSKPSKPRSIKQSISSISRKICWTGYERIPGTKPFTKHSCRKIR